MRFLILLSVLTLGGCSAAERAMNDAIGGTQAPSPTFEYDVLHGPADWSTSVYDYRGRNGDVIAFDCQGDPSASAPSGAGSLYGGGRDGRGLFSDDSKVCWAGVYAGVISRSGGRMFVEVRPESDTFPGGFERNGVSTVDWPSYEGGGFVVLGAR